MSGTVSVNGIAVPAHTPVTLGLTAGDVANVLQVLGGLRIDSGLGGLHMVIAGQLANQVAEAATPPVAEG